MAGGITIKPPKELRPSQRAVLRSEKNRIICCSGRQWGKSTLALTFLLRELLKQDSFCWWISPTYKQAKKQFNRFLAYLEDIEEQYGSKLFSVNKGDLRITVGGGVNGQVYFLGADNPKSLRGDSVTFAVMDEFAFMKQGIWEYIVEPTFLKTQGRVLFISTPNAVDDDFHDLYKQGLDDDDWDVFHYTSYTDASKEEIIQLNKIKLKRAPDVFDREYLAKFVQPSGARIKPNWIKEVKWNGKGKIIVGVDNAISTKGTADSTAIVLIAAEEEDFTVIHANKDKWTLQEQIDTLKQLDEEYNLDTIVIERSTSGIALIQEMNKLLSDKIEEVVPRKNKLNRFEETEARYYQGSAYHANNLELYIHPEFRRDLLNFTGSAAGSEEDDFADALAHAVNHMVNTLSYYPDEGGFHMVI